MQTGLEPESRSAMLDSLDSRIFHNLRRVQQLHNSSAGVLSLCYLWETGLLSSNIAVQLLPSYVSIQRCPVMSCHPGDFGEKREPPVSPLQSAHDDGNGKTVIRPLNLSLLRIFIQTMVSTRPSLKPILGLFFRKTRLSCNPSERRIWDTLLCSLCVESLLGCFLAERVVDMHANDCLQFAKLEELLASWNSVGASYQQRRSHKASVNETWSKEDSSNVFNRLIPAMRLPVSRFIIPCSPTTVCLGFLGTSATPSANLATGSEDEDTISPVTFVFAKDPYLTSARARVSSSKFPRQLERNTNWKQIT